MIKLIFEAVFLTKAKVQISPYSTAFGYGFQIFNKFAFLRSVAIWGGWQIGLSKGCYK